MPRKFALFSTAFVGVVLIFLFLFSYIFTVKNISIHTDYPCVTEEEVNSQITIKGQSLFLIQKNQISEQILKKISCIEKVDLKTKLPSTLEISYSGKNPVARVDSSDIFLTASGLAISVSHVQNLPTIFPPEGFQASVGTNISDPEMLTALKIVNSLSKSDFVPTNVRIVNDSITVYNQQDSVVIFSTKKQAEIQTDSLQKVLAKAKIESKKISKIDMRFDNPIIVFE